MKGVISAFRGGKRTRSTNQMIIIVNGIEDKEKAKSLINKTAVWKSPAGKEIKGQVRAPHGSKGALRVMFEKGMPGQSLGTQVEIK